MVFEQIQIDESDESNLTNQTRLLMTAILISLYSLDFFKNTDLFLIWGNKTREPAPRRRRSPTSTGI